MTTARCWPMVIPVSLRNVYFMISDVFVLELPTVKPFKAEIFNRGSGMIRSQAFFFLNMSTNTPYLIRNTIVLDMSSLSALGVLGQETLTTSALRPFFSTIKVVIWDVGTSSTLTNHERAVVRLYGKRFMRWLLLYDAVNKIKCNWS